MPQSLAKIYLHIIFSTKNREPFLANHDIRNEMHAYLGGTCKHLGCPVLSVSGVSDHVHICCMLSRTITIADLIGEIKRESSKWIKSKGGLFSKFAWQNGYSAFSVGLSEIDRVKAYIAGQEEHHRKKTFQDELRVLYREYGIKYNERYVWD
jgi:putative transposase